MRLAAIEIEEAYKKDHFENLMAGEVPQKDIAGLAFDEHCRVASEFNRRRARLIPPWRAGRQETTAFLASGWTEAMIRALDAKLAFAAEFSTFDLEKPEFEAIAKMLGSSAHSLTPNSTRSTRRSLVARAVVLKRLCGGRRFRHRRG